MPGLAEKIDALLPQTQCGLCGFPGCKPYADAIANGVADINRCSPGGESGVKNLAILLGVAAKPLKNRKLPLAFGGVAYIDEAKCIGCTACIQACPVDAILGSSKLMHSVIASECTGCERCIPPCPVDCISMHPTESRPVDQSNVFLHLINSSNPALFGKKTSKADHARNRFNAHQHRLEQEKRLREEIAQRKKDLLVKK